MGGVAAPLAVSSHHGTGPGGFELRSAPARFMSSKNGRASKGRFETTQARQDRGRRPPPAAEGRDQRWGG